MDNWGWNKHCKISNIRCTNSDNLNDCCLVLQLSLPNPLKPVIKLRMKMELEQRRQALLQLHLSDQQFYCQLRCTLYERFDGKVEIIFSRIFFSFLPSFLTKLNPENKLFLQGKKNSCKYSWLRIWKKFHVILQPFNSFCPINRYKRNIESVHFVVSVDKIIFISFLVRVIPLFTKITTRAWSSSLKIPWMCIRY